MICSHKPSYLDLQKGWTTQALSPNASPASKMMTTRRLTMFIVRYQGVTVAARNDDYVTTKTCTGTIQSHSCQCHKCGRHTQNHTLQSCPFKTNQRLHPPRWR